ncbi:MAG: hypothetical protein PVH29_14465 [Candidatus Zixiibacteriota bacterium]|jgi:hypothetical protein
MLRRNITLGLAGAAFLLAMACNVKNVEVHGSYDGAGMRDPSHPVMMEMFNLAFEAVELPAGSVSSGEYVGVYRLSSGKAEDQWWCYLSEDWLVKKIRDAGAYPVERNVLALRRLEMEGDYFDAPKRPDPGGVTSPSRAGLGKNSDLTPYRATRALAYRVVAADLWIDGYNHARHSEPTVRANSKVTLNLRTLDVRTGEVLWSGTVVGSARRNVKVSRLLGWYGIYDWDDWDDWDDCPGWWWYWRWDDGDDTYGVPPGEKGKPLDDDRDVADPAPDDGDKNEASPAPPEKETDEDDGDDADVVESLFGGMW